MSRSETKAKKFILLTTQRSGSTYIRLWLNSHPNVRCHSEVFFKRYPAADGFKAFYEAHPIRHLLYKALGRPKLSRSRYNFVITWVVKQYLNQLFNNPSFSAPWTDMTTHAWKDYQPREHSNIETTVGYQLMYDQLSRYSVLSSWITNEQVSIIHLIRTNTLKLLLSRLISKKTNQYHFVRNGTKRTAFLDPQTVIADLDRIVNSREAHRQRFPNNPFLEITYKQFFSNHAEEAKKIFAFLGVEETGTMHPSFLKKLNPDRLEDLIENYDEIASVLQKTPYQKLLD